MRISMLICLLALWPEMSLAQESSTANDISLRLIWFGGSGGVSSHIGAHNSADIASARGAYRPQWAGPLAFVNGGRMIYSEEGLSIQAFRQFMAHDIQTNQVIKDKVSVLRSPFEWVYFSANTPQSTYDQLLDATLTDSPYTKRSGTLRRLTSSGGSVLLLESESTTPFPRDPSTWEVHFAQKGLFNGQPMYLIGRPLNEGTRRTTLVAELIADAPGDTLTISSGDNVETHSYLAGDKPDLQRPNTWASMTQMSVDALVPSAGELAFGAKHLSEELKTAQLKPLAANYPEIKDSGWLLKSVDGAQVLIIGLVDTMVPGATDPLNAVETATAAATKELGRRPDLIVATGHLTSSTRTRLISESRDLDLLLGTFERLGIHGEAIRQTASGSNERVERAYERHPLTIVQPGDARVGVIDLSLRPRNQKPGYVLRSLHSQALPVTADTKPDSALSHKVQTVRHDAFAHMQQPLLPDLGPIIDARKALRTAFETDPSVARQLRQGSTLPSYVTPDLWRRLCTQVFKKVMGADLAVLPRFGVGWTFTGPTSLLRAIANFNVPGEVVILGITGAQLTAVLPALSAHQGTIAGLAGGLVAGHKIDPRETYYIAMPSGVVARPEFAALAKSGQRLFTKDGHTLKADSSGKTKLVREAVINGLAALGRGPLPKIADQMDPPSPEQEARWMLDIKQVSLGSHQYRNSGEQAAYGDVKETRVKTADNRSVSYRAGVEIAREGPDVTWLTGTQIAYDKAYYEESDDQETIDELKFSTELKIPAWTWKTLSSVPFVGSSYATEFTPTETDGVENPRKKLLEGVLGLAWSAPWLKSAKFAGVVARDLSAEIDDPQYGFLLSFELTYPLPLGTWFLKSDSRYFIPGVGEDDASELGLTIAARTGIDVPIWERLSVGLYLDTFTYRGQVEETNDLASSFISGFALKYDHRIRLDRRGLD